MNMGLWDRIMGRKPEETSYKYPKLDRYTTLRFVDGPYDGKDHMTLYSTGGFKVANNVYGEYRLYIEKDYELTLRWYEYNPKPVKIDPNRPRKMSSMYSLSFYQDLAKGYFGIKPEHVVDVWFEQKDGVSTVHVLDIYGETHEQVMRTS